MIDHETEQILEFMRDEIRQLQERVAILEANEPPPGWIEARVWYLQSDHRVSIVMKTEPGQPPVFCYGNPGPSGYWTERETGFKTLADAARAAERWKG